MTSIFKTIPEPFQGFLAQAGQVSAMDAVAAAAPPPVQPARTEFDSHYSDLMFLAAILSMCDDNDPN